MHQKLKGKKRQNRKTSYSLQVINDAKEKTLNACNPAIPCNNVIACFSDFPENNYEVEFSNRANYQDDVTDLGHKMMAWPEVRIQEEKEE